VYLRNTQPGIIVEQTPRAGTAVKHDRIIFLTVNAMTKKIIPLPNLINVSERQATYTLSSLGFEVGNIEVVPSEFSDLVLDVKYKGYSVAAGKTLVDGASLTLVVGKNGASYQGQMAFVPDLTALFLPDAQKIISEKNLVVGYIDFDVMPANEDDKKLYKVYRQNPERGESVIPGKRIDIYLSKDANKAQKIKGQQQEDDFF
jgi:beta-lactam-binding protein with PASTA domain